MPKKATIILAILLSTLILCACGSMSKYQTGCTWALDENYCFAVEVDNFDGDVYQAGNYKFSSKIWDKKIPAIYDIYVSQNLYNKTRSLQETEFVGSVGGIANEFVETTLSPGDYVYVIFNPVVGENGNQLIIECTD